MRINLDKNLFGCGCYKQKLDTTNISKNNIIEPNMAILNERCVNANSSLNSKIPFKLLNRSFPVYEKFASATFN
jgi:hypothetical protein